MPVSTAGPGDRFVSVGSKSRQTKLVDRPCVFRRSAGHQARRRACLLYLRPWARWRHAPEYISPAGGPTIDRARPRRPRVVYLYVRAGHTGSRRHVRKYTSSDGIVTRRRRRPYLCWWTNCERYRTLQAAAAAAAERTVHGPWAVVLTSTLV